MLIVTRAGKSSRLEKQPFADEAALQHFIYQNPEAIPLDEADAAVRLHVLGREFPTSSGPIDVLATDSAGHAYIIETKLYKNPDKRLVLSQVLDYGAALWSAELSVEDLLGGLRHDAGKRGAGDPVSRLAEFLEVDEDVAEGRLEELAGAFSGGRFTAVVLMDHLGDRLRDLIPFMNDNSRFRLLAVELDYYRHDDTEIVNPRVFGAEARRSFERRSEERGSWSESVYFERLLERTDQTTVDAARKLFAFAAQHGEVAWGSGAANPSMIAYFLRDFSKAPFVVFSSGKLVVKLPGLVHAPGGETFIEQAAHRLGAAGLPVDLTQRKNQFLPPVWVPRVDGMIDAFRSALAQSDPGKTKLE